MLHVRFKAHPYPATVREDRNRCLQDHMLQLRFRSSFLSRALDSLWAVLTSV